MSVTLGGTPIEVSGSFPKVGDTAPDSNWSAVICLTFHSLISRARKSC